jgi:hypothetical protein
MYDDASASTDYRSSSHCGVISTIFTVTPTVLPYSTACSSTFSCSPHPAVQLRQLQIYEHGYTRPFTGAVEEETAAGPDPAYTEALAAANAGSDRLDYGWQAFGTAGAPRLLAAVTHAFNLYQVPFFYKTLTIPPGYRRADASVLYLRKRFCL